MAMGISSRGATHFETGGATGAGNWRLRIAGGVGVALAGVVGDGKRNGMDGTGVAVGEGSNGVV